MPEADTSNPQHAERWECAHYPIGSVDLAKHLALGFEPIGGYAVGIADAMIGQPSIAYMVVLRRWLGAGPPPYSSAWRPSIDLGLLPGGAS